MRALVLAALLGAGCSHVPTEDRYPSKAQVIEIRDCKRIVGLKGIELALFHNGFYRGVDESSAAPIPFALLESLVSGKPRLVTFYKPDYDGNRETLNRYKVGVCEEPGGGLYLLVVRHDPVTGDQFIGKRFADALSRAGCQWAPLEKPRELGFYRDTTEDDALRHMRRGECRAYSRSR
jgi:hypothetical protein